MEQVLEFTRAAAPWIAMGLLLAIFAVRSADSRKRVRKGAFVKNRFFVTLAENRGKEAKQLVAFFDINRSV